MINSEDRAAYKAFLDCNGLKNNENSRKDFLEKYRGVWQDEQSYAENYICENYDLNRLPQWAKYHIDYNSIARDMFIESVYAVPVVGGIGGIYVFGNF